MYYSLNYNMQRLGLNSRQVFGGSPTIPLRARPQLCTVCAKPTKAADFRQLSEEEIENEIRACEMAYWQNRLKQNQREAYKSDQFGWNRNKIAQLKTVLREREIAAGIDRRESKKIEKCDSLPENYPCYFTELLKAGKRLKHLLPCRRKKLASGYGAYY